jgi:Universal stress protein UspA and related nucleotide-binding proteins
MKMQKILCPIDLGSDFRQVTDYAAMMAKKWQAEVLFFYVISTFQEYLMLSVPQGKMVEMADEINNAAQISMRKFVDSDPYPEIKIYGQVVRGNPKEAILEAIDEYQADLVVMGAHHQAAMLEIPFLGSTTEKIIRTSPVPVLTVQSAK